MSTTTGRPGGLGGLRVLNVAVGLAHLVQGVVILALANDVATPVTASFLAGPPARRPAGPPGDGPGALELLTDLRVAPFVARFLFLAAADHLLMATPPVRGWYERNLRRGRNTARWIEYSVSASVMVVLIAMLTGISDIAALIGIFGANAAMILFGLLMEGQDREGEVDWLPYAMGCVVGAVPWIVIAAYLFGGDQAPAFVYATFVSLFILFNCFAVNMALHFRRPGPWRDVVFSVKAYVATSLVAKSALAWQVFASTLVG